MTTTGSINGRPPTDPQDLRDDIARTRAELGETVEALAAKADVKARAHAGVEQMKTRAHDGVEVAKLRMREGASQVMANAVYAVREIRANPRKQLRLALTRLHTSVREHPAPWVVATAVITLAGLIAPRRRRVARAAQRGLGR